MRRAKEEDGCYRIQDAVVKFVLVHSYDERL